MSEAAGIDFGQIPLVALRAKTRHLLSLGLDCPKILLSPSGHLRDWRGLADVAKVPLPPCGKGNPTCDVLGHWERSTSNFDDLKEALKAIDRWDVLDDIEPNLESDAKEFLNRPKEESKCLQTYEPDFTLTDDDVYRKELGLGPQIYDAFLLFADDDKEFAMEIVNKLEGEYNSKLCIKDRDLLGGISIEHEAVMRLIAQRCKRVIIVLSQSFFDSSANKFFVAFAQALAIREEHRKIIPCTYKNVQLPVHLQHYFILNYDRANNFGNFWDKLNQSIKAPVDRVMNIQIEAAPCVKAIEWKENMLPVNQWDCKKKVKSKTKLEENKTYTVEECKSSKQKTSESNKVSIEEYDNANNNSAEVLLKSASNSSKILQSRTSTIIKRTKQLFKNKNKKKVPLPS